MSTSTGRTLKIITAITVTTIFAAAILGCSRDDSGDAKSEDLKRRLKRLRSVPYTSVTTEPMEPRRVGVVLHEADKAYGGYNIYCSHISPKAFLMDMNGKIVHEWSYPTEKSQLWNHAVMLDKGDLLVINKLKHLLKLDWNSNLLWRWPMEVHHDIAISDHTFYVILREIHEYRDFRARFSAIAQLTLTGEEIFRWSTFDHFGEIKEVLDRRSFIDTVLDSLIAREGSGITEKPLSQQPELRGLVAGAVFDYFHLNTITIIPENGLERKDARFRAGNLLICFRNVNQIAVLDKDTWEILWAWGEGTLEWPHHPTMLDNGNILLFDNGVFRKFSTVLELNPLTEQIEWKYNADPPTDFYSYTKGSAQRLPNGNTLICEGDNGRAIEVTRTGEVVWEWINPASEGARRVQVYRMTRLSADVVELLLEID